MDNERLVALLDEFCNAKVLVLGDVMLDRFVYGIVERISPEAPIPIMSIERSLDVPGGAANVARNLASMGARATLLGVIGEDSAAHELVAHLKSADGIESILIRDSARPTTVKTRYVAQKQQVLRVDSESCAPLRADVAEKLIHEYRVAVLNTDVIVLSDYAKGVLTYALTKEAIYIARALNKPIIIDPKSRNFAKYAGATVLTPNRYEIQLAAGHECITEEQIVAGARRFLDEGVCESMVVTRGKDGMSVVRCDGTAVHLHTAAREIFDVSGAGDTVLAALSIGLAVHGDLVDVSRLANIAAGIVVGKSGTAIVTAEEIAGGLDANAMPSANRKIFTLPLVTQLVHRWRERGLRVAFTNGCFDILHPGHTSLLDQARRTADRLVVGLNADASVRRLKGIGRPVQSEVARATVLTSLKSVDAVVIFSEDTPLSLISALEPDVLIKGADYTKESVVGAELVLKRGGQVILADLVEGESTTNTLRRIAGRDPS